MSIFKSKATLKGILNIIKKKKRILLVVHVSPDLDSLSSCLAMERALRSIKKKVRIISYSQIPPQYNFLTGIEKIIVEDLVNLDPEEFDVLFALDSAQVKMLTRSMIKKEWLKKFLIINVDHHFSNTRFGKINLIEELSSTAEILFWLFKEWGLEINKSLAEILLYGIVSDTGCFRYNLTGKSTFIAAAELIEKGASLKKTVLRLFKSYNFKTLKYWGIVLKNMQIDEGLGFVWSKISKRECEEEGILPTDIDGAADSFLGVVNNTEFGLILNEEGEGFIRGSLRSRDKFNVAKLAEIFGGGGHKAAAGFSLNMTLEEAERRVIDEIGKMLKKS